MQEMLQATPLDTSKADKKIWLVKVPGFVGKRWLAASQFPSSEGLGPELARVRFPDQVAGDITLSLTGPTAEGIPREYFMHAQARDSLVMHAISDHGSVKAVEGRVDQKFDVEMRPAAASVSGADDAEVVVDPEYSRIARSRQATASTRSRTMQEDLIWIRAHAQVIDEPRSAELLKSRMARNQAAKRSAAAGPPREKAVFERRVRMDQDDLERLLFRLFEQQEAWQLQPLVKATDQPVAWLREVLSGIAVLTKRPKERDAWVIKPEYRSKAGGAG